MLAQQSESRQTELNFRGCEGTHGDVEFIYVRLSLGCYSAPNAPGDCRRRRRQGGAIVNGLADSCKYAKICQTKQTISPLTHQTESQPVVKK